MLDFALVYISKKFRVIKIFLKKCFKLYKKQDFYLTQMFILVVAETNLPINKKSSK